ncbi:hypothetical protein R3W88_016441 [Solanum pinnatisectum]|uniref:CCHC-type domain-containing protein n=1 Tax=Solanum pinnatisectum TaxID=50273 RepID=A0AAV9KXJ5_9SOLN|nr:hypothetical protein R3W88_016441 [Solanum pinnatisectum]
MVADMRSRMSLFVARLSRLSNKEGKAAMPIWDMDIARLMIHVQQVKEDKLRNREKFKNKRAKTSGDESGQQKSNMNRSSFQPKRKGPAPSSSSIPAQGNKGEMYRDGSTGYFKCGQNGHFMRECPENRQGNGNGGNRAQSSSDAPPELHLEELLQGQVEDQTIFMLSLVTKSKRILQMLSLV